MLSLHHWWCQVILSVRQFWAVPAVMIARNHHFFEPLILQPSRYWPVPATLLVLTAGVWTSARSLPSFQILSIIQSMWALVDLAVLAPRDWAFAVVPRDWVLAAPPFDLVPVVAGRDWVPVVAGRDWVPVVAGRDWVPVVAGRDWALVVPSGDSDLVVTPLIEQQFLLFSQAQVWMSAKTPLFLEPLIHCGRRFRPVHAVSALVSRYSSPYLVRWGRQCCHWIERMPGEPQLIWL
jgi:hypothetical protein